METNKRLPHLRRDINYFLTKRNNEEIFVKYKNILEKLVMPKYYNIKFYGPKNFTFVKDQDIYKI